MTQPARKLDERASAFIDERMDDAERARFEAELADDPDLEAEVRGLEGVVSLLRKLPAQEAPPDFLDAVKSRIRRRTRGRWFGLKSKGYRFPYEAVINGILLGLLMAVYIMSMPAAREDIVMPLTPEMARGSATPAVAAAILKPYGRLEVVSAAPDGGEVVYLVELPSDRLADLEKEVGLYPDIQILEIKPGFADDTRKVWVRARDR